MFKLKSPKYEIITNHGNIFKITLRFFFFLTGRNRLLQRENQALSLF